MFSDKHSQQTRHVVIVGGGTAGWLTAARLAHDHCSTYENGVRVTVVESPDVKTIGVGEGSWPTLRITLKELGINESEFLTACDVTLKQGSKFVNWCSTDNSDAYYHPFSPPQLPPMVDPAAAWQKFRANQPYAFVVCAQPNLAEMGLGPKQAAMPDYASYSNYGYHLNAGKFSEFMRDYCVGVLGVDHQRWHIDNVTMHDDGRIKGLTGRSRESLDADLFIDCSGMARVLMSHYDTSFVGLSEQLFNNRAIAAQVSYTNPEQSISTVTTSTAQADGWIWDIGLTHRRGTGFVYSDRFTDDEQAAERLAAYLKATGSNTVDLSSFKHLRFKPGYLEQPWQKNCVAIGMSAGFVEPLEASAIAMIEVCSKSISEDLPNDVTVMETIAKRFNRRFRRRWASIADFLKLHYVLSERQEPYWLAHKASESIPESLQEMLDLWQSHTPGGSDFEYSNELFGPSSFQYILYGMGHRPSQIRGTATLKASHNVAENMFHHVDDLVRKGIRGLPKHRDLLDDLAKKHANTNKKNAI